MASDARERANLSLHAAHLLRDRAARVTERVGRRGRPRQRFLHELRARLAGWSLPVLATEAALTGAMAAITLAWDNPHSTRGAAIVEASMAIVLGAAAMAVPFVRKHTTALVALVASACVAAILGWGVVAHLTGGSASRYLLVVPLALVVALGIVPLPWRASVAVAIAGYLALLVADPAAPVIAHFLVLAIAVGGVWVAWGRQKMILRAFVRIERLSAAVERMRRMQEQLVVVEKLEALRV